MNITKNEKLTRMFSVVLAVVFGVLFVTLVVNAITTISTAIVTEGALTVGGVSTLTGNTILSTASSTGLVTVDSLKVDGVNGSTVSGIIFGYCNLAAVNPTTASTTYALCTGATGVTSTSRVFIQATSSFPAATMITAASSTATSGTINVRLHGEAGSANIPVGTVSLNFWAVR